MNNSYVTIFIDINRHEWTHFKRTFEDYLNSFKPFISLFHMDQPDTLYAFIDSKFYDSMIDITKGTKIKIIKIDYEWMDTNLYMWKTLPKETEIMRSEKFRSKVPDNRLDIVPETYEPRYTLLNHCKIDFINYVIDNFPKSDFYTWVDFGYFKMRYHIPQKLINLSKVPKNKIVYHQLNNVLPEDTDPYHLLKTGKVSFAGYCFLGTSEIMKQYQKLFHEVLHEFQNVLYIADDDQAIVIQCVVRNPSMFSFFKHPEWHVMLAFLQ